MQNSNAFCMHPIKKTYSNEFWSVGHIQSTGTDRATTDPKNLGPLWLKQKNKMSEQGLVIKPGTVKAFVITAVSDFFALYASNWTWSKSNNDSKFEYKFSNRTDPNFNRICKPISHFLNVLKPIFIYNCSTYITNFLINLENTTNWVS